MNRILASILLTILLTACTTAKQAADKIRSIDLPSPNLTYKVEIVQGNFVSSEQVAALRPGMPRGQVKNILGTPLLTDIFHADRWDYVFTITRDGKTNTAKRLTVYFKGDALDRHEGDAMPSEVEFVKTLNSGRKVEKALPLAATDKQLAEFAKRENPKLSIPVAPEPVANPDKVYPSLESK
jgi:outer membrane protein assembly factor BamE